MRGFQGFFDASQWFFGLNLLQVAIFEVLTVYILYTYGTGWIPWLLAAFCQVIVQVKKLWFHIYFFLDKSWTFDPLFKCYVLTTINQDFKKFNLILLCELSCINTFSNINSTLLIFEF